MCNTRGQANDDGQSKRCSSLCSDGQTNISAAVSVLLTKAVAILTGDEERLDHLRLLEVAAKLIQFV